MYRVLIILALLVAVLGISGCFSYDPAHNASHWAMIKQDLQVMHEDADFMLGLDKPAHASRTQY